MTWVRSEEESRQQQSFSRILYFRPETWKRGHAWSHLPLQLIRLSFPPFPFHLYRLSFSNAHITSSRLFCHWKTKKNKKRHCRTLLVERGVLHETRPDNTTQNAEKNKKFKTVRNNRNILPKTIKK